MHDLSGWSKDPNKLNQLLGMITMVESRLKEMNPKADEYVARILSDEKITMIIDMP
jgi:hypothetical protein